MKNISYFIIFLLCAPSLLCASEKAQEPLMSMARSVSSEGPSFEGAVKLKKIGVVDPIPEERPEEAGVVIQHRRSQAFTFATAARDALAAATSRPPKAGPVASPRSAGYATLRSPINADLPFKSPQSAPAAPSPKNASGGSSRRGSRDSLDNDPQLAGAVHASGQKNTKSLRARLRRLRDVYREEQQYRQQAGLDISPSLQTIDGELVKSVHNIDTDALAAIDKRSIASDDDVREGVPKGQPFPEGEHTPSERIKYLLKLKKAKVRYTKDLESFSSLYVSANEEAKALAVRRGLTPLVYEYYGGELNEKFDDEVNATLIRDLEEAHKLGCCASCTCVIL